jgi:hypothetical protein
MRLSCLVALGAFVLVAPSAADAREVSYRAPAGCPTLKDVTSRLAPQGRAAKIEVTREAHGFRGEVVLGEGDARVARSVEGKTCGAVVEALALVVALDRAPDDEPVREEVPTAVAEAMPPPPDAPVPEPVAPDLPGPPRPAEPARAQIATGLAWSATSFREGHVLQGPSLFGDLAGKHGVFGVSWLVPSARLSVGKTLTLRPGGEEIKPEFDFTWAAIDLCPVGTSRAEAFVLAACGRFEAGALDVGHQDDPGSTQTRFRGLGGAVVRARYAFGKGSVQPFVEITGGVLHEVTRENYHFLGRYVLFGEYTYVPPVGLTRPSPWAWMAGISAGVAFR